MARAKLKQTASGVRVFSTGDHRNHSKPRFPGGRNPGTVQEECPNFRSFRRQMEDNRGVF